MNLFGLLLIVNLGLAAQSQYKLRIHKSFIERVLARNLAVVFEHTDAFQLSRAYLHEVDAYLDDIMLSLISADRAIDSKEGEQRNSDLEVEIFLVPEENSLLIEILNLEFAGTASIFDPLTGEVKEKFEIEAPFDRAVIELTLGQQKTQQGHLIPLLSVQDVQLKLTGQARISGFGEMQLYKTHAFEQAIHTWLGTSISKRE